MKYLLGLVLALVLFAGLARADGMDHVRFDFSHALDGFSTSFHLAFDVPSVTSGYLPPGQSFDAFIGPIPIEFRVTLPGQGEPGTSTSYYCVPNGGLPVPPQQMLADCGFPSNVGDGSESDWTLFFPNQFPIQVTYGPNNLVTGAFVPGTYDSVAGVVLTVTTPEPSTGTGLLVGACFLTFIALRRRTA